MGSTMKGFVPDLLVMIKGSRSNASPWASACPFKIVASSFIAAFPSAESLPAEAILARRAASRASARNCWPKAV